VEFALTLVLLMSFMLFFVQLSLVLAFGNYVHYATFMAARAYLSAGSEKDDQQRRATEVIVKMLKRSTGEQGTDKFPFIAKGVGGTAITGLRFDSSALVPGSRDLGWLEGVQYHFKSRLFMLPFAPLQSTRNSTDNDSGSLNSLTLVSESYLGKEMSYYDCVQLMRRSGAYFDNGC
jgi:hypothetical protein